MWSGERLWTGALPVGGWVGCGKNYHATVLTLTPAIILSPTSIRIEQSRVFWQLTRTYERIADSHLTRCLVEQEVVIVAVIYERSVVGTRNANVAEEGVDVN